jgi:hypothetical protein
MTPDDVVATFLQHDEYMIKGKKQLPLHGGSHKTNLALKAKHVQVEDSSDEEEGEEGEEVDSDECPSYDEMALFVKKFNSSACKNKGKFTARKKVRSCYNCESNLHFADACPYEKREDRQRFPKKNFVKKLLPNLLNTKLKKREGKAMIAQDESYPDDVADVADVAQDSQSTLKVVNKKGDVIKYDYMKDYKGNSHKCLMAKMVPDDDEQDASPSKTKVSSSPNPPLFTPKTSTNVYHDA